MTTESKTNEKGPFGKHYASMYQGSMMGAGAAVFAVMGYVISNQRPAGQVMVVELNPKLLAFVIGEAEGVIQAAVEFLCAPDPKSRTKVEEGKRLVKLGEYSYRVVNGRAYREMRNVEVRREQNREAQRRLRGKRVSNRTTLQERVAEEYEAAGQPEMAERVAGMTAARFEQPVERRSQSPTAAGDHREKGLNPQTTDLHRGAAAVPGAAAERSGETPGEAEPHPEQPSPSGDDPLAAGLLPGPEFQ